MLRRHQIVVTLAAALLLGGGAAAAQNTTSSAASIAPPATLTAVIDKTTGLAFLDWADVQGAESYGLYEPHTPGRLDVVSGSESLRGPLATGENWTYSFTVTAISADGVESRQSVPLVFNFNVSPGSPTEPAPSVQPSVTPTVQPPPSADHDSDPTKPLRHNTGWVGAGSPRLTVDDRATINESNVVIERVKFTNRKGVNITGSNVTIRGCVGVDQIRTRDATNVLIEDCDAAGFVISGGEHIRLSRVYTTNEPDRPNQGGDALHITNDGRNGPPTDVVIEDSFFGNPSLTPGSHYDNLQVRGVNGLIVRRNNFDQRETEGGVVREDWKGRLNATIYLERANGGNSNVTIENNWLFANGWFNVRLNAQNLVFKDNILDGPATPLGKEWSVGFGEGTGNTWSGNRLANGTLLNP